jgi:hypothetical protein
MSIFDLYLQNFDELKNEQRELSKIRLLEYRKECRAAINQRIKVQCSDVASAASLQEVAIDFLIDELFHKDCAIGHLSVRIAELESKLR